MWFFRSSQFSIFFLLAFCSTCPETSNGTHSWKWTVNVSGRIRIEQIISLLCRFMFFLYSYWLYWPKGGKMEFSIFFHFCRLRTSTWLNEICDETGPVQSQSKIHISHKMRTSTKFRSNFSNSISLEGKLWEKSRESWAFPTAERVERGRKIHTPFLEFSCVGKLLSCSSRVWKSVEKCENFSERLGQRSW